MEITDIEIFPFETGDIGGNTLAIADVTFDKQLKIKALKIVQTKSGGIYVAYPNLRGRDGKYHDIIIVNDRELKKKIRDRVVEEYKKTLRIYNYVDEENQ